MLALADDAGGRLRREIYDEFGYVDVAVDQLVTGRYDLYKWLSELGGHRAADVVPVHLVGYVHDLRLPFKRHGSEYPHETPVRREIFGATVTDGLWFKARVDADRMREYGGEFLRADPLDDALDGAVMTGSPIDFTRFDETYRDAPRWLHVAGSGWGKKNVDVVLDVGRTLYDRFGIRTVMTNTDPIVDDFVEREFVEAHPEASRDVYERALAKGDLTVCATDHETMARTWFEQAASGQVLVARDRPWIRECVPDGHRLCGDLDSLADLAVWAVEHWDEAVEANRRLVDHVGRVRSPSARGNGRSTTSGREWPDAAGRTASTTLTPRCARPSTRSTPTSRSTTCSPRRPRTPPTAARRPLAAGTPERIWCTRFDRSATGIRATPERHVSSATPGERDGRRRARASSEPTPATGRIERRARRDDRPVRGHRFSRCATKDDA